MPKKVPAERRYLEMHGSSWRVTVTVPEAVRGIIGKSRLRHDLGTDSLRQANLIKGRHVEKFRAQIRSALATIGDKRLELDREACELAEWKAWAKASPGSVRPEDWEAWRECVGRRTAEIRGEGAIWHRDVPIEEEDDDDLSEGWEFLPGSVQRGNYFSQVAHGDATPVDARHAEYLAYKRGKLQPRTLADDVRAMQLLLRWLTAENIPPSLESVTRRRAQSFAKALPGLANVGPATANKYLSRLSSYWQWLSGVIDAAAVNPWRGVALPGARPRDDEKERAFTNGEVARLLSGPAAPHMHDLMMLGALTLSVFWRISWRAPTILEDVVGIFRRLNCA